VQLEGWVHPNVSCSILLFWSKCLRRGKSTGDPTKSTNIGSEGDDVIIPVHEQKSIDKSKLYAVSFHEISAEGSESN